jgi:hypothetical protein
MTRRLPGWVRLPLVMIAWAAIAVAAGNAGPALAIVVAVLLVALWLWRLRAMAEPDQTWAETLPFAIAWAAWGLAAWIAVLFLTYVGFFVGAYLQLWELPDDP